MLEKKSTQIAKKTLKLNLQQGEYLDKAKTDDGNLIKSIPSNSIIYKRFTGLGGTTLELKDTSRSSIIVIPDKNPSQAKLKAILANPHEYSPTLAVYGGITHGEIREYLTNTPKPWKFLTTAEGLKKIVESCDEEGIDWRNTFFGLFDEYHSMIVDYKFRKILYQIATTLFVQFTNSSFMSATPVKLTDPVFNKLQVYEVAVQGRIPRPITIITTKNIVPTIVKFIQEFIASAGTDEIMCVFINCVTKIEEIMHYLGEELCKDVSVYCTPVDNNKVTLDRYKANIKTDTDGVTKLNFLTQGSNQGWDLHKLKPTMVYLTDVNGLFTHQNLKINGCQALGRARDLNANLFHITNLKKDPTKIIPETAIAHSVMETAELFEANVNLLLMTKIIHEDQQSIDAIESLINPDNDYIEFKDGTFKINHAAVGRLTQMLIGDFHFTSVHALVKAWSDIGFAPTHFERFDKQEDIEHRKRVRTSAVEKKRDIFTQMETYSKSPEGSSFWGEFEELKAVYPQYWSYLEMFGFAEIERFSFNTTLLERKYRRRIEEQKMNSTKFRRDAMNLLSLNTPYLRPEFKQKTETLFNENKIKSAKPTGETFKVFCEWKSVTRLEGTPSTGNDNAFMVTGFKDVSGWDNIEPQKRTNRIS